MICCVAFKVDGHRYGSIAPDMDDLGVVHNSTLLLNFLFHVNDKKAAAHYL